MGDRQIIAIMAAILVGSRPKGELIDEAEAVSDALEIWKETVDQCHNAGIHQKA